MVAEADGPGHLTQVRGDDLRDLHVTHPRGDPAGTKRETALFRLHGQVQEDLQPAFLRPRRHLARVAQSRQNCDGHRPTESENGFQLLETAAGVVKQDGHTSGGDKWDELDVVGDKVEPGASHPDPDECGGLFQDLPTGGRHLLSELARQVRDAAAGLDIHGPRRPLIDLPALPHEPGRRGNLDDRGGAVQRGAHAGVDRGVVKRNVPGRGDR